PVIAIWILNEPLFDLPGVDHLPFKLWNQGHNLLLSEDMRIDLLQLPKWPGPQEVHDELDRWFCLFREGGEADIENLPDLLQSHEMKEAVQVLHQISESQREYFIYQQRLEALSLEATKQKEREETQRKLEETREELEKIAHDFQKTQKHVKEAKHEAQEARHEAQEAKHEVQEARHEAQEAKHEAQEAKHEAQEARQREAQERQEKERFLALLRKEGIDPEAVEPI
ncbi:MAG: hypothetical protein GY801_51795, partial [bacterium]|nr:hypothetical protein [bacterium]